MTTPTSLFLVFFLLSPALAASERLFVLTDIENEPDDAQSLVRLLVHSNQYDIEGLVATTSVWQPDETAEWRIAEILEAYREVQATLAQHEPGFPRYSELKALVRVGVPVFGMKGVGEGMDSEGSNFLIEVVDRDDPRPVWINAWGGTNVLAQALWTVRATRSQRQLDEFIEKIRVYTISDQDDSGPWIRKNFPNLFYIVSPGYQENGGGSYHFATWSGISGDKFHGRFQGPDFSLVNNEWVDTNLRRDHGPLGAQYPHIEYLMEGDTPSFLYLFPNGLSVPERPNFGSWGGRYALYTPPTQSWFYEPETRPIWSDTLDEARGMDGEMYTSNHATIWRWREEYQNEFAARMDWTVRSYEDANHPPVAVLQSPPERTARWGESFKLSASGSTDPDGDSLAFEWFHYKGPGTFRDNVEISRANQEQATVTLPGKKYPRTRNQPHTLHFIVKVTDDGEPALTRYRRVVVTVH